MIGTTGHVLKEIRSFRASKKKRKIVKYVPPDGDWTAEYAMQCMPPTGYIIRDDFNGRWRAYYGDSAVGRKWNKFASWGSSSG